NQAALRGIIFVLRSGIPWQMLPAKVFQASGSTCWRRLRDWTAAGIWPELHRRLLDRLGKLGGVDLEEVVADSQSVRAVKGGRTPARTRRIGGKRGANATR